MRAASFFISLLLFLSLFLSSLVFVGGRFSSGYNLAYAEVVPITRSESVVHAPPMPEKILEKRESDDDLRVQAVLSSKERAVIAGAIEAKIAKFNFNNGDLFKKGDVLIEYDCTIDYARLKEAESRQRVTEAQFNAYEKLHTLQSISDIEFLQAKEADEQNKAVADQIRGRIKSCRVVAPFDGRVTNKMASQFEFVQTGRVLMDISSRGALRAEFLIPSKWLQWLNTGTVLKIYINETDRHYTAKISAIHGEVDPVSQSIQVVAEMEAYHEELLPGMSGQAIFNATTVKNESGKGFLGLILATDRDN
jgi:RND family efflux transporter MFP subunit